MLCTIGRVCVAPRAQPWRDEEVEKLKTAVQASLEEHGRILWAQIAKGMVTRTDAMCRRAWSMLQATGTVREYVCTALRCNFGSGGVVYRLAACEFSTQRATDQLFGLWHWWHCQRHMQGPVVAVCFDCFACVRVCFGMGAIGVTSIISELLARLWYYMARTVQAC
jgi:hypothetical protein